MTEQDHARGRHAQRVRQVPVRRLCIGVHAGLARHAFTLAKPAVIVREEIYAEVAEPGVELRTTAEANVAVVPVRDEYPGSVRGGIRRGDYPCTERGRIGRPEPHHALI